VAALTGASGDVIAIDGKTARRSYQKKGAKEPIHMVSAFAARQRLVLGQVKVAEKSNEIVAIPKLLDMMAIEGAIMTIDAMGCQRDIAKKILEKKADNGQSTPDSRWRSRPHRNQNLHGNPRCCLAAGTPRLARIERRRHGREQARNRR
jgi:hypothetical protein